MNRGEGAIPDIPIYKNMPRRPPGTYEQNRHDQFKFLNIHGKGLVINSNTFKYITID